MPDHLLIPMDIIAPSSSEEISGVEGRGSNQESSLLEKTPTPIYRHAAPSGPWPWMDFDEDIPSVPRSDRPEASDTPPWSGYPQSKYPNWTKSQVDRCKMLDCPNGKSTVSKVDVFYDGKFGEPNPEMATIQDMDSGAAFWNWLEASREENIRVRALFVENMTVEVLKMLGMKYNIEPFFFSSSANWIPSRYQEGLQPGECDHITVILPFIRVFHPKSTDTVPLQLGARESRPLQSSEEGDQIIDTQRPLRLKHESGNDVFVFQDLLSVHMVRNGRSSTIISYHPGLRRNTASQLYSLINRTGDSVYWQKIFEGSKDPTCLLLCFLWYAIYQWDEVFEILYAHINYLEQQVLDSQSIHETRDLHIMQAHLLYHRTLLEDFRKTVIFVQGTNNPAMQDPSVTERERNQAKTILAKETEYLLSEIERLESQRMMQVMRLKNVINLAFATVNIEDSKYMKELTVATVRDSAAMKQISYLTMVFLPANFLSNVFSMNVVEINPSGGETLRNYIASAIALTAFASWVAVALQVESGFFPPGSPFWRRASWPAFYVWDVCLRISGRKADDKQKK